MDLDDDVDICKRIRTRMRCLLSKGIRMCYFHAGRNLKEMSSAQLAAECPLNVPWELQIDEL